MKQRTGEPWMAAPDYGRSLKALTLDLLVHDVDRALRFHREVLGAEVVYSDPDFAVVRANGGEWMLHADHTYEGHPMAAVVGAATQRGAGIILRVHGCDPDKAEQAALRCGFKNLASVKDKPHGLREMYCVDPDGYVWAPDVPVKA
jgi:catechol 2,3-dioxygenase-like lactoylglutathione lyase family enzyme